MPGNMHENVELPSSARFVAVIPVGPSPQESERLRDLLDSLTVFEPLFPAAVLVSDRSCDNPIRVPQLHIDIRVLHNPRNRRRTRGVYDGLACGLLEAYQYVNTHFASADFVLKLDTDALIIAPFAERLAQLMDQHPAAGMVGATDLECDGTERSCWPWTRRMRKHTQWLQAWRADGRSLRKGLRFRLAVAGRPATIRRHVLQAVQHGYRFGSHAQGGAYGLRGSMLGRWREMGVLRDPNLWQSTMVGEDAMFGMYTRAAGFTLLDAAHSSRLFGVAYKGLPMSPHHLVAAGYAVVHSVKSHQSACEATIRQWFQEQRRHARECGDLPRAEHK